MDREEAAAITRPYEQIVVSHELTVLIGRGAFDAPVVPENAVAAAYGLGAIHASASLTLTADVAGLLGHAAEATRIILLVSPSGVTKTRGQEAVTTVDETRTFHLPVELRAIALALRDCDRSGEPRAFYLIAKAIELLCETWARLDAGQLIPLAVDSQLSRADSVRILAVKQLIEERWAEKLSLEKIAAACGLNREKLTRGFREMFACTIAEAIAERRLQQASVMLLTTDLPVSSVGYENGYLNNASFARAFGRRFGMSPSDYRACRLAA